MSDRTMRRMLSAACGLTLVALALMVYSVLVPRPVPVILAMSVGQGIGTLAFALYLAVLAADLVRSGIFGKTPPESADDHTPANGEESEPLDTAGEQHR